MLLIVSSNSVLSSLLLLLYNYILGWRGLLSIFWKLIEIFFESSKGFFGELFAYLNICGVVREKKRFFGVGRVPSRAVVCIYDK